MLVGILVNGTKNVVVSPKKYAENPHQCNINVGPSRHPLGKMEFWRKGAFTPDHKVKSWKVKQLLYNFCFKSLITNYS